MNAGRTVLLSALACAGCVTAPTRDDASAFKVRRDGSVPPAAAQSLSDCLLDGFGRAHFALTNINVSQQVRGKVQRIETRTNGILLISADVHEDGRTQLLESSAAKFIDTTGEIQAFDACLAKYRPPPT
jgi:hypothetical protein